MTGATTTKIFLKKAVATAFDFIFPNLCVLCGEWIPLTENTDDEITTRVNALCRNCEKFLIKTPNKKGADSICRVCGKIIHPDGKRKQNSDFNLYRNNILIKECEYGGNLSSIAAEPSYNNNHKTYFTPDILCHTCKNDILKGNAPSFKAARTSIIYNDTARQLIHLMKYSMSPRIAVYLARYLAEAFGDFKEAHNKCDIIIPVPLYWLRQLRRGYNQSEILARELSRRIRIPCLNNVLKRRRSTTHQARLGRTERLKNVKDVFEVINPDKVKGKKILLVDDVMTTGATFNGCAAALKSKGAEEVYCLAVARRME